VIFWIPAAAYPLYYLFWGRWLFTLFSPGGIRGNWSRDPNRVEQFSDVLGVQPTDLLRAAEVLTSNMIRLGIPSLVLLVVFVASLARILRRRKSLAYDLMICGGFFVFPIVLTASMIASRPVIYTTHLLWFLFYAIFAVQLFMATTVWSLSLANFKTSHLKFALAAAFVVICATGAYEMPALNRAACVETAKELDGFPCGTLDWIDRVDEQAKHPKSAMFRVRLPPDHPRARLNHDPT
jgi:hypothetical protein